MGGALTTFHNRAMGFKLSLQPVCYRACRAVAGGYAVAGNMHRSVAFIHACQFSNAIDKDAKARNIANEGESNDERCSDGNRYRIEDQLDQANAEPFPKGYRPQAIIFRLQQALRLSKAHRRLVLVNHAQHGTTAAPNTANPLLQRVPRPALQVLDHVQVSAVERDGDRPRSGQGSRIAHDLNSLLWFLIQKP